MFEDLKVCSVYAWRVEKRYADQIFFLPNTNSDAWTQLSDNVIWLNKNMNKYIQRMNAIELFVNIWFDSEPSMPFILPFLLDKLILLFRVMHLQMLYKITGVDIDSCATLEIKALHILHNAVLLVGLYVKYCQTVVTSSSTVFYPGETTLK